MPISSSASSGNKKNVLKVKNKSLTPISDSNAKSGLNSNKTGLALKASKVIQRSNSTLSVLDVKPNGNNSIALQVDSNGAIYVSRTAQEKETGADRLSLDKRGLTGVPLIKEETRLRLLSMQHNLMNSLENFKNQQFPTLVFLDVYNNQIDRINNLDLLINLRVLLMGKNRLKKIESLENLRKLEVLDLHGNQITQISGLSDLNELKVLNLAGNQIKAILHQDLDGLKLLQELNLRRNRLKKLLGFGSAPNLQKLFLSNNEVQNIEDMSSIVKCSNIKELSMDNNPISLTADCIPFLVSYFPNLINLNSTNITDTVRKTSMTWRRNKESSSSTFMDLSIDLRHNVHREDVISNARTNWELLKTQTKCLSTSSNVSKQTQLVPDSDIILTSLSRNNKNVRPKLKGKVQKKINVTRSNSQETELSVNTSSNSNEDFFRLPPILVPIINKLKNDKSNSSVGPNVDSSISSLLSSNSDTEESSDSSSESEQVKEETKTEINNKIKEDTAVQDSNSNNSADTCSNLSTNTSITVSSSSGNDLNQKDVSVKSRRSTKSASNHHRTTRSKVLTRASTAKPKRQSSPITNSIVSREREQGGDYLIEICGRHLNIYGQGALHFIDKSWSSTKTHDVTTINFNYANFNYISGVLCKIKSRFPNAANFVFKETNIACLGQINALAEIQGLTSLEIGKESNPIVEKDWRSYAIYRLSHWGLKVINGQEVTDEEVKGANEIYQSLSDLVFWTLPDALLHPLLARLRIDVNSNDNELNPKHWLMSADSALRSVVSKEALQWKKTPTLQEELIMRHKAKCYMGQVLQEMTNSVKKLRILEERWPNILYEIVHNTLLDYSQLDIYMKRKLQELK